VERPRILIVDDEEAMCESLVEILEDEGFDAVSTLDPSSAQQYVADHEIDLILMDIRMPTLNGIDLLRTIKERHREIPVVMITGYPSVDTAVQAMQLGAANFFSKPLDLPSLIKEVRNLTLSRAYAPGNDGGNAHIVWRDRSMATVLEMIDRAGGVDAPVLVTGETGTGKELVAQAIHERSRRRGKPFVRVNCAAIPDTLIESELFGHEAGAFTDAKHTRKGRFESANGGTLFLDEIGDMSLATQARILHALQEKTFERVGGSTSITADVRIVAATHRNLQEMIGEGTFREDLFYRLSVISIRVPALRDRGDDVVKLAEHFVELFGSLYKRPVEQISEEVLALIRKHRWPGNVRELRNCIERGVIFSNGSKIRIGDLPAQYVSVAVPTEETVASPEAQIDRLNRSIIEDALAKSDGVKSKAAELLHISRRTLYNRMKRLGMD
jgi:DNA-binding NtrC family response regulator